MKNIKYIVMSCGYAEDSSISFLIFESMTLKFNTPKDAITELALDLYERYSFKYRKALVVNKCCKEHSSPSIRYCPICGRHLCVDDSFDYEEFLQYIISLHYDTVDTFGNLEFVNNRDCEFTPILNDVSKFIASKSKSVVISHSAEYMILYALLKAKPELCVESLENYPYSADWERLVKTGTI